jgi:hypothetical protein
LSHTGRALGAGVLSSVALVTAYSFIEAWLTAFARGGPAVLSPSDVAFAALLFSIEYGIIIAIVCIPLWLLLARVGLTGPCVAALLGFTATLGYWMISNYPPLNPPRSGIAYALCGAVAGLVTWWVGNRR